MQAEAYDAFIEQLTNTLEADSQVQGFVLVGSTASQSRFPDQWSDHDFFVITTGEVQEKFRTNFDWLPDHQSIVLTVRETEHGLKVLYKSGHLLEYAVFALDEIKLAKVNDYAIVFDRGGVAKSLGQAVMREPVGTASTNDTRRRDQGMFLCLLVVGAGRVARGEVMSGQVFIRTYALGHLLSLLAQTLPAPNKCLLDNLDPYRRFEEVFPHLSAKINAVLARDPIHAARGLLDIFDHVLHDADDDLAAAIVTVRDFLVQISS